ncbi:MAG: T9SS type A sorting domain-containing protein [Ignavibacteria bacterium]|nr:T9SS type A sorting domain-containing protein [Ignavibacteria bacterium]
MKHLAPFIKICLSIFFVGMGLYGCATKPSSDANVNPQARRAFEEMKYRDVALGRIPEGIQQRAQKFVATLPGALGRKNNLDELQNTSEFKQVGPWNIGGRTRTLALDVTDVNVIIVGSVSGGVWRSEDAGVTWTLQTKPDQLHSVTSIAQDTRNGKTNIWYYGTGESYGNSAQISGNGIWKSTNSGKDWSPLASTISPSIPARHAFAYNWRVATSPLNGADELFVATSQNGIYRSTDGGATFTQTLASNSYFSDVMVTPQGVVYASLSSFTGFLGQFAVKHGVFRSADGINWQDISPTDMPLNINRIVFDRMAGAKDRLFVLAETPGVGAKGVFKLRDGDREQWHSLWKYSHLGGNGADTNGTWDNRSASIPLLGGRNGDFFSQGGYDLLIKVSPTDSNLVIIGGTNLYRNTNAFKTATSNTWIGGYGLPNPLENFPTYPNHHPDQHNVVFHPKNPSSMYSVNDGGVMRTDNILRDTVEWVSLNKGYHTTQFYAIAITADSADSNVMGGMQDNGTWSVESNNPQSDWIARNGGDGAYCYYADGKRTVYAATQTGRIRRIIYNASGVEIGRTRIDPQVLPDDYLFINPYVIDPHNNNIVYHAGGFMLWRNNDASGIPLGKDDSTNVNWDSLLSTSGLGLISAVAVSNSPANIVYFATTFGNVYRIDSANLGQPLAKKLTGGLPVGFYANSVTIDERNAQHAIVCYSNYGAISMYATTDGGETWSAVSGNLEQQPNGAGDGPAVNWAAILPYADGATVYVAGTSTGVFATNQLNGGSTVWQQIAAEEIGNVPVDMVLARASDKTIFVGTHGRGVFKGKITSISPPPSSVQLVSPPNSTRGISVDTVLVWNKVDGAVSYTVEVATDASFSTIFQLAEGIRDTLTSVRNLTQGNVKFYWRVAAYGVGGKGAFSAAWTFTTSLLPPFLILPAPNAQGIVESPVKLTWSKVEGASSYDVELSNILTFNPVTTSAFDVTDTTTGISGLENNKRYYWHVRSNDLSSHGIYSQRSSFVTGTISGVQDEEDQRNAILFSQNPVSISVAITAETAPNNAIVDVINVEGRIVKSSHILNGHCSLNVENLSNGNYIVRITAGGFSRSETLVISR